MERAALAHGAFDPDLAAVLFDDAAANVQAEPDARVTARIHVRCPAEPIEDAGHVVSRDPDAVIAHGEVGRATVAPRPDFDRTVLAAVLEAVLDQVVQELLDPAAIKGAGEPLARVDDDPLVARARALRDLTDDLSDVEGLAPDLELPFLDPRRIKEILDERGEPPGLPRDTRDPGLMGREGGIALEPQLEDLGLAEEGRERRFKVVRGGRNEVLLELRGLFLRLHPGRLVDECAALEDHRGLVSEQLQEGQVICREHRPMCGERLQDADPPDARGDRRHEHGTDAGGAICRGVLRMGPRRVRVERALLCGEHAPRQEAAISCDHLGQCAMAVVKAQNAPGRLIHADGSPRPEGCADPAFQLAKDRIGRRQARQRGGPFEERAQLRLLPVAPELRWGRESQQPAERCSKRERLGRTGRGSRGRRHNGACGRDQDREAEERHAGGDRLGPPSRHARGSPAEADEADGRVERDAGEICDEAERRDRIHRRRERDDKDDGGDESAQGRGPDPKRHRREIREQPQHQVRERHNEHRDRHADRADRRDAEQLEDGTLQDRDRERAEEEGDVHRCP